MTKTSYTKEEFQLIASALEREKKKASQIDQLKLLLMTLKQKHDLALAQLAHQKASPGEQSLLLAELQEENQLFSQQISKLKQSLQRVEQELAQNHLQEASHSFLKLQNEYQNSQEELHKAKQEVEGQRNALEEQNAELSRTIHVLEKSAQSYRDMAAVAEQRLSDIEKELIYTQERNLELNQDDKNSQKEFHKALEAKQEVERQRNAFQQHNAELTRTNHTLETSLQSFRDRAAVAEMRLADIEKELIYTQERNLELNQDDKNSQKELHKALEAKQEVEGQRNAFEQHNAELSHTVHALETSLQSYRDRAAAAEMRLADIEKELLHSQERNLELNHAMEMVRREKKNSDVQKEELLEKSLKAEQQERLQLFHAKEENERALQESKKHAEQLERVIHFLRERSEEAQLELLQLRQDYQTLQTNFAASQIQVEAARKEIEQQQVLLQKERSARQETAEEWEALQGQFSALKAQIHLLQNELKSSRAEIAAEKQRNETLDQTLAATENKLRGEERRRESCDQEVARIKQTLIRAVREAQELQAHYQAVVEEKISLFSKCRQTQSLLDRERNQQAALQHKLDAVSSLDNELRQHLAEAQQQLVQEKQHTANTLSAEIAKQEQQAALIRQREETILDLQRQVGLLRHEGEKARDELERVRSSIAENQTSMQEAEAHLARKVKESAELAACNQAQHQQIEELQQVLQASKIRIAELHASCDMYEQQQKRMQEQLQEAVKAYEGQQAKWEDKYLALYDKWQTAEGRIKELEKLEERYRQLQGLFSNVGTFLNPSSAPQLQTTPVERKETEPQKEAAKEAAVEKPKGYSNLFDLQKPAARPKQNLLD